MDIKKRAPRDMEGHGEYATFILQKASKIKKKLHGKKGSTNTGGESSRSGQT